MKFEVGEVVIHIRQGPNYGKETTILSPLHRTRLWDSVTGELVTEADAHTIDASGFVFGPFRGRFPTVAAMPQFLRKKDDDSRQVRSWDDSTWKPEELKSIA